MNTLMERELCNEILDESALQQELTYGTTYRQWKGADERAAVNLKESPINVPFKLCRASQKAHKKKKKALCKCEKSVFEANQKATTQVSLLDRSALSQDKYMNLLSIPHNISKTTGAKPKSRNTICCKCQLEPCSPRLIQMSVPNKRYVLQNWKDYQHFLPTERLLVFDRILKSGNNLDPREARYYFKQLRRKQQKELKRRIRLCRKKKKVIKKKYKLWFQHQIAQTVDAIVDFIKNEPLFMLNFHQMVTSDELLKYLKKERVVKVKSRNTKCVYKKTVVEISDKMIKWMDAMSFFADIQPVTSKEKLLEVPSLEGIFEAESGVEEEEEEGEEEEEEEEGEEFEGEEGEEMGKGRRRKFGAEEEWGEDMLGEEGIPAGDAGLEAFMAKKLLDKARQFGEDDDEMLPMDFLHGLGDLDEDMLNKLIQILSMSPQDFLNMEVQAGDDLAGVTYNDILKKLIEIRDGKLLEKSREKNFLEQVMTEWAKNNDPESIDDKLLDKIHETSALLAEWFKKSEMGDLKGTGLTGAEGEEELKKKLAEIEGDKTGRIEEEGEEEFKEAEEGGAAGGPGAESKAPGEGGTEGAAEGGAAGGGEVGAEGAGAEGAGAEGAIAGAEGAAAGAEGAGVGAEGVGAGAEGVGAGAEGVGAGAEGAGADLADAEGAGADLAGAEGAGAEGAGVGAEGAGTGAGETGAEGVAAGETGAGAEGAGAEEAGAEGAGAEVAGAEGAGVGAEVAGAEGAGVGAEGAEGAGAPGDATAAEGAAGEEGAGAGVAGEGAEALGAEGAEGGEEGMGSLAKGEGEEGEIPSGMEGEGLGEGEGKAGEGEGLEGEEELEGAVGGPEISEADKIVDRVSGELQRLDSLLGIIRGHKPSITVEHEPGTICCLSLKIWAVWLLEIANNAHNWTKWIGNIIKQVRHYASVIRGDHVLPSGEKKVLYKEEWRQFVKDTEEKVIAWRHYSKHVKDLSEEIMENFHGKKVTCCPKCLQDHLIKNVVTAHETLQSLTEAINCAAYWQRCLDKIVEHTSKITELEVVSDAADVTSEGSDETYSYEIEELSQMPESSEPSQMSYDSMYEIEELPLPHAEYSNYEITEYPKPKPPVQFHSIEEMHAPNTKPPEPKEPEKKKSGKKRDKSAGKGKKSSAKKR